MGIESLALIKVANENVNKNEKTTPASAADTFS